MKIFLKMALLGLTLFVSRAVFAMEDIPQGQENEEANVCLPVEGWPEERFTILPEISSRRISFYVDINGLRTVYELKTKLEEITGASVMQQVLLYGGSSLMNDACLRDLLVSHKKFVLFLYTTDLTGISKLHNAHFK